MKAQEIRERFSNFFQKHGHLKIESSSLVPHNDKTLLFANAGMNQFKDYFTGKTEAQDKRAVTIQKVVRAGGKHNDLDNVGFTARHHTFFEMLGNFSFGDYFKREAIQFAWQFLTEELQIPAEKLLVTVHYSDDEALKIWNEEIGVPKEKIFKKGDKDNFWEMGDIGPCGPCSEIFFDYGPDFATPGFVPGEGQDLLDDEQRYIEIWNLVFMQFEKTAEGKVSLPRPSIDTGAGLERVAAAMQNAYWNYDTDIFDPIFAAIEEITGKKYVKGPGSQETSSMRVVADHARSATMLITDGVIPSNEGRGYVLRRIIRRAIRHLKDLGAPKNSFYKLVPAVFDSLGQEYPQNAANAALAEKFLLAEEEKFLETLDTGLKFLNDAIAEMEDKTLDGETIFKLYDTYGFPADLTEIILNEKGLNADMDGFEKTMAKRKEESKKSWKGAANLDDKVFFEVKDQFGATDFLGYSTTQATGKLVKMLEMGEQTGLIFDATPFYGESGGQAGDKGTIEVNGDTVVITDTQKPIDGLHVLITDDAKGLEEGQSYEQVVSSQTRELTKRNHSATHLLQSALIHVLGEHVKQAGSQVTSERLRFDFTNMSAMTREELDKVEDIVNDQIQRQLPVVAASMSMDEAMEKGAMALFGEKYGDEVRVLTMGDFSTELCGGTHVSNTSEIGYFTILSESALSSGVRRIEATTSTNAFRRMKKRSQNLAELELMLNEKGERVVKKVETLMKDLRSKLKEIEKLNDQLSSAKSGDLFSNVEKREGYELVIAEAPQDGDLRKLSDLFTDKFSKGILLMYQVKGEKISVILRATKGLKEVNCSNILREALNTIGGRGGGRPDMAQGSGEGSDISSVEAKVRELLP